MKEGGKGERGQGGRAQGTGRPTLFSASALRAGAKVLGGVGEGEEAGSGAGGGGRGHVGVGGGVRAVAVRAPRSTRDDGDVAALDLLWRRRERRAV
jgi:hypothetical protein